MSVVNNEAINTILGNYDERIRDLQSNVNKLTEDLITVLPSVYGNVGDILVSNGNAAPNWQSPVYFHAAYITTETIEESESNVYTGDLTNWTEGISNPSGQLSQGKTWTAPQDGIYYITASVTYGNSSAADIIYQSQLSLYLNTSTLQENSIVWSSNDPPDDDFVYIENYINSTKQLSLGDTLHLNARVKMNSTSINLQILSDNTRWNIFKIA